MTLDEYQQAAKRTLLESPPRQYTDQEIMLIWCALGLAGEAGELADDIKKAIFHDTGIDLARILKEAGDVMWYLSSVCTELKLSLDIVMQENIYKLEQRYPEGFIRGGGKR